jgi:hypothetical protein
MPHNRRQILRCYKNAVAKLAVRVAQPLEQSGACTAGHSTQDSRVKRCVSCRPVQMRNSRRPTER